MPISTYKTFLMHKGSSDSDYTVLVPIKDFGDLGGDPELLDITTLSDNMKCFINGIKSADAITFNANYDKDNFTSLKALENQTEKYAVWLGATEGATLTPTGSEGKFSFEGQLSVRLSGGSVNAVQSMAISIAPSTPITFA